MDSGNRRAAGKLNGRRYHRPALTYPWSSGRAHSPPTPPPSLLPGPLSACSLLPLDRLEKGGRPPEHLRPGSLPEGLCPAAELGPLLPGALQAQQGQGNPCPSSAPGRAARAGSAAHVPSPSPSVMVMETFPSLEKGDTESQVPTSSQHNLRPQKPLGEVLPSSASTHVRPGEPPAIRDSQECSRGPKTSSPGRGEPPP